MNLITLFASLALLGEKSINLKPINPLIVYSYKNSKLSQTVKVQFLSKNKMLFEMKLFQKESNTPCILRGQAYINNSHGVEIDTDENGNAYASTAYNFYSSDSSTFVSFRFQGTKNLANAKRLQISSSNPSNNSCNYNSTGYILLNLSSKQNITP
jgi:hypothetical protein